LEYHDSFSGALLKREGFSERGFDGKTRALSEQLKDDGPPLLRVVGSGVLGVGVCSILLDSSAEGS